jgi:hypothetical protein
LKAIGSLLCGGLLPAIYARRDQFPTRPQGSWSDMPLRRES